MVKGASAKFPHVCAVYVRNTPRRVACERVNPPRVGTSTHGFRVNGDPADTSGGTERTVRAHHRGIVGMKAAHWIRLLATLLVLGTGFGVAAACSWRSTNNRHVWDSWRRNHVQLADCADRNDNDESNVDIDVNHGGTHNHNDESAQDHAGDPGPANRSDSLRRHRHRHRPRSSDGTGRRSGQLGPEVRRRLQRRLARLEQVGHVVDG